MLDIQRLSFRHPGAGTDILKGIDFRMHEGRMTTLLGPNGSGKTTLFKCISGLWQPREGAILFGGKNMTTLSSEQRAGIIAIVPQEHEPPFSYSISDVVLMGRAANVSMFSSPSKQDVLKSDEAMETVGIFHLKDRPYTKISGGERQLVLIARALAQETPILILDEPTSHLDFRNQILILTKVREIARRRGLTVLMTLHDPNLAMLFSNDVVMINEGTVMSCGLPGEVITADNLKRMYGINVAVISHNGTKIICPEVTP